MTRGPLGELSKRAASRGIAGCLFLAAVCAGAHALNRAFLDSSVVAWVLGPALGFCLLLTALAAGERLRPQLSVVFTGLSRYGDPAAIASQIDRELTTAGADMRTGSIWLTPSWIVGLTRPAVFRLADLVGIGVDTRTAGYWRIVCWERGQNDSHAFDVSPAEGDRVRERLRQTSPGLLVADIDTFEARWKADRLVCEAAALACGTAAQPPAA